MVKDFAGQRFGRLTVIEFAGIKNRRSLWKCQCDCGTVCILPRWRLKRKNASCGCSKHDPRPWERIHGGKGTRLYECWRNMRYRCDNPTNQAYKYYGARGIKVCPEWYDFAVFREWALNNGYTDELTIDRIDSDGNYEPANCRWSDDKTQMNNRRMCPRYEYDGVKLTLSEWAHKTGIPRSTIFNRLRRGWSFENAINTK